MTKKTRKGLGEKSALLLSTLAEKNKNLFTLDEALAILKEKKSSVTKLLHDLTKNNWLFRLSKSKYLILPLEAGPKPCFTEHEFTIASALIPLAIYRIGPPLIIMASPSKSPRLSSLPPPNESWKKS